MKALLALIGTAAVLTAPPAFAGSKPDGYRIITDTLGGYGHPKSEPGYRFTTENSATQNRLDRPAVSPGYQFVTENSASQNRLDRQPVFVTTGSGFRWADAGIGASAAVGAMLVVLGGGLVLLRRRGRLAI
jgi:hypothetical protein